MSSDSPAPKGWTLERAAAERGPVLHPLAGATFGTFLHQYFRHRHYSRRSRRQRLVSWLGQFGRGPFAGLESLQYGRAVREHVVEKPPIFLVGHWRSGTTHLHNLLSRDPQFGFLDFAQTAMPSNMLSRKTGIGRDIIQRVIPETRGYDNVKLSLQEPQEEEMALGNLNPICLYNTYYFPGQLLEHSRRSLFFEGVSESEKAKFEASYEFLVRKLSFAHDGKQLLFKNPPSTTRIPMLKKLFPGARFVHIVRNPYPVYRSNVAKFARLFNAFAWQDFLDVDLHAYTIKTYEDLMKRYLHDREALSDGELFETSYEKITEDPLGEVSKIYDAFGIDGKEEGLEHIGRYVEEIRGYKRNVHQIKKAHADEIRERWAFSFEHWGYSLEPPEELAIEGD